MTEFEVRLSLLAVSVVLLAASLVCLVLSFRWRRRRGLPTMLWRHPELAEFGGPLSPVRRSAARVVRRSQASGDPQVAHVVRSILLRRIAYLKDPWHIPALALLNASVVLNIAQNLVYLVEDARLLATSLGLFGVLLAVSVPAVPLLGRRARRRAERTLALNGGADGPRTSRRDPTPQRKERT
ncbi:hypothetical protein [Nocardiopsis sp. MG754419]|uniref:hypothetical protein n=1 Tax=Nocardiopsis sp. MG754419 TaxID=2259865 RepID=UPI001BA933B1|nr:hypothetical protein [Nocardiopsis sp. MG754419]MBR8744526.1 hypothetical protein [Nocardiopsis sp. MG754419]